MHCRNAGRQIHAEAGVANVEARSANQLAEERTDLATTRTLMAADRTLMAWTRTALSMISFGFTIYKLLEGFREAGVHLAHPHSPRTIGLFLTGIGTISMVLGTIEYWRLIASLRAFQPVNQAVSVCRPTFFVALIMALAGSFLFMSIVVRLL
jgi:putative membrane protein